MEGQGKMTDNRNNSDAIRGESHLAQLPHIADDGLRTHLGNRTALLKSTYLVVVLVLCLSMTACSSGNQAADNVQNNEASMESSSQDSSQASLDVNEVYLADVVSNGVYGIYVTTEGSEVATRVIQPPALDSEIVVVDRTAGQQLIMVGGNPSLDYVGACIMTEWGYHDQEGLANLTVLDEINGVPFETEDEAKAILAEAGFYYYDPDAEDGSTEYITDRDYGYIASATKGATLKWGQYQGTEFVEGTFVTDVPYYRKAAFGGDSDAPYMYTNGFECPFVRTKDGYFTIDVSGLEPGYYLVNDYADGNTQYPIQVI